jgi:hypothetical protein
MKNVLLFLMAIALVVGTSAKAVAFNSGSTGTDGALNPTANIAIQLPASGIFNYTTVNIPAGVTVTFYNNASNTPAYILSSGNVTIAGTISVNGANGNNIYPGISGPGGFEGGLGGSSSGMAGGNGLGPGGGNAGATGTTAGAGGGGGFGAAGNNGAGGAGGSGGAAYGNNSIVPLVGGSGGGGGNFAMSGVGGGGGGGGGGAIIIASSGTINVTGTITANGGSAPTGYGIGSPYAGGGGGSGGGIRLIANTISVNGTMSATGGSGSSYGYYLGGSGGVGRIRLEANTITGTGTTTPAYTFDYPSTVFVTNVPALVITTIGGVNAPSNPSGQYGSPDVILPLTTTNPVTVTVAATNIPAGTTVTVTAVPEYGSSASATGVLSGTNASSTTSASVTLSTTYQSIITASATYTIQTSMYWNGEKIDKVRVASTMRGGSKATFVTESGKEIKATELLAKLSGW